ncbi:MAG: stage II sporulation protein D [Oscillospiraceae bacterium]|nr:stage II sporulation protein D [Oscillospiraceae bacterium]
MKEILKLTLILTVIAIAFGAASNLCRSAYAEKNTDQNSTLSDETKISIPETITVYKTATGETEEMPLEDYVLGAVLGEIPGMIPLEAMKAQAIVARTYAVRRILTAQSAPDVTIGCADISDNSGKYRTAVTPERASAIFGEEFEDIYSVVKRAVSETAGKILTYDGYPIIAAFHTANGGMTESAENVWGWDAPYLVSTESEGDLYSEYYGQSRKITAAEYKARISAAYTDGDFSDETLWEAVSDTDTGYVKSISVGGIILTGEEFARIFTLESAVFTLEEENSGNIVITVYGSGNLVGMSIVGAAYMAESGASCEDILEHYFAGTEIAD